ncbi:MAG TPA: hypothetical protein VGR08_01095 [Thermomicrobiales bacterium]|nr:hypothetical protein [Thermomicrobiales bacterium]
MNAPTTPLHDDVVTEPLNRSIDRFLFADGWRVSDIAPSTDPAGFAVTLTKTTDPGKGHSVTRSATSRGEAVLKACSSARAAMLSS